MLKVAMDASLKQVLFKIEKLEGWLGVCLVGG
jgi:hypothetical protein